MKERKVLLDVLGNQTRRVVLEDGVPVEFAVETHGHVRLTGNVYLGRVANLLRGMQAAFVDIGLEKNAFLSLDDLPPIAADAAEVRVDFHAKPLRPGQEIIVQVVKEPGGDKGPRITMNPTFPGKYLVLLPTLEAVGVSRHIQTEGRREALYNLAQSICPPGMGLIIRTAAEDAPEEAIAAEAETLCGAWLALAEDARTRKAPSLLYDDGSLLSRARRDLNAEITLAPFDEAIEAKLEKALARKVWLPSGAYLVMDHTEAMTVIDVNSGKFTGKRSLGDTLLRLNIEAAKEIARLLRLRDVGGIVVIDFVDMETDEDRQAVLEALQEALSQDRAKHHVHGFTGAGLLEMTRRPVYQPVSEALLAPCPRCHGEGAVPSVDARANALQREIRRRRAAGDESQMTITAPGDVIAALERAGNLPERIAFQPEGDTL